MTSGSGAGEGLRAYRGAVFDSYGGETASLLVLFTDSYKVRGTLRTRRRRLTDVLNAEDTQFLVLEEVIFEELGSGATIHRAPYAQVNLNTVLFGITDEEVEPMPDMKTVKVPQQALISMPPFTIRGHIHLSPEPNLREALNLLRDRFVPVTEAWYWSDYLDEARTQSPMLAFNHSRAQILAPYEGEADVWEGLGGTAATEADRTSEGVGARPPRTEWPSSDRPAAGDAAGGPDRTWEGLDSPQRRDGGAAAR
jgi:hypothetical protein